MLKRKIYYLLHNGKNSNLKFFVRGYLRKWTPAVFFRMRRKAILDSLEKRPDREDILRRVDYYCKLNGSTPFDREQWRQASVDIGHQPITPQKVYYFDAMDAARYFDPDKRWILKSGDVVTPMPVPTVVKSRPISDDNQNNVLLKLVTVRHFLFVDDKKSWREKKDMAVFRGDLGREDTGDHKYNRTVFMKRWYGYPMIDAGSTNPIVDHPGWLKEKMTIGEHLDYKFVMSLEGNDVASNLKWIMSSNSIAVTPRLTCETWFMEGTLIPNYHYIEVKEDFSDLEERLQYYIDHPEEAEAIIQHAHEYVAPFKDKKRERLISLLVLRKYFEVTNREA